MPRRPKPWFRKSTQSWYVQINGKQEPLGPDEDIAWEKYRILMSKNGKAETRVERVDVIFDEFLDWVSRNLAERTYESYRDFIVSFVDRFPDMKVPQLKPRHVTTWLNEQETWNDTTKGIAVRSLKRGFNWAVAEGIIDHNPIAALKRPPSLPRETIIAPDQWREIFDVVPDQEFRDFLIVLKNTGARPGEIRQMEARHVHGDVVIFPKVSSKGKRYNRVIYPNKEAKAIISRLMERYPEGPLFRNTRGKPWTASAIAVRFKRLTKRLGFKSFAYAFRHTFATEGLMNGCDSTVMANLLGHQDLSMVARTYSHLVQNQGFLLNEAERATGGEDPA